MIWVLIYTLLLRYSKEIFLGRRESMFFLIFIKIFHEGLFLKNKNSLLLKIFLFVVAPSVKEEAWGRWRRQPLRNTQEPLQLST